MAQFEYVPGINTVLNDGNLQALQTGDTNSSILVIGSASNGPINQPVKVASKDEAQSVFGPVETSNVTRGIFEVLDNTEAGVPDVRGMRIGEPKYANVSIRENQTGTGVNAPTTGAYALKLTARNAGELYNSFTARFVTSPSFALKIDNPVTGYTSVFPYSTTSPTAIQDLVNAINVDSNVGPYLMAEYTPISGYYGFAMASGGSNAASGVTITAGQVDLDMTTRWTAVSGDIAAGTYTYHGFVPPGETNSTLRTITGTSHNKLSAIERLYEVASVNSLTLNPITSTGNLSTFTLPFAPQKYHTNSAIVQTLNYLADVEGVGVWPAAAASGKAEFIATYKGHLSDAASVDQDTTFVFENIMAPPDIGYWPAESGATSPSGTLEFLTANATGAASTGYTAPWCTANSSGLFANDINYPRFKFKINLIKGDGTGTQTVYDGSVYQSADVYSSGLFDADYQTATAMTVLDVGRWLAYNSSAKTLTVTLPTITASDLSGCFSNWNGLIRSNIKAGDKLSIDFVSCRGVLTEVTSVGSLTALNQYYYSPEDNTITFGGNLPALLNIGYKYFDTYTFNTDYEITGTYNQIIRFDNANHLPGSSQSIARGTVGESWVPPQLTETVTPLNDRVYGAGACTNGSKPGYFFVTGTTVVCNSGAKLPYPMASGGTTVTNGDKLNAIMGIKYTSLPEFADTTVATYRLSGGGSAATSTVNRINFSQGMTALADAGYEVDYIVPVGIYLDAVETVWNGTQSIETPSNFHKELETLLATLHDNYSDTQVVMSVKPPKDFTLAGKKKYYDDLVLIDPSRGTTAGNIYRDVSFVADRFKPYFKVTAGDGVFQSAYGNYSAAWNTAYAAWLSSAPYGRSVTNAPLKAVRSAQLLYNGAQLNTITEAGYVALRQTGNGIVVNAGVTAASVLSDFRTEHVMRVTIAAVRAVREACNPFLGQVSDTAILEAMRTAIERRLRRLVDVDHALNKYEFTINATAGEIAAGKLFINLELWPTVEVRRITIRVSLNGGLGITG